MEDRNWVYRNRKGRILFDLNAPVFFGSSILIGVFVVFGILFLDDVAHYIDDLPTWIANTTGSWSLRSI